MNATPAPMVAAKRPTLTEFLAIRQAEWNAANPELAAKLEQVRAQALKDANQSPPLALIIDKIAASGRGLIVHDGVVLCEPIALTDTVVTDMGDQRGTVFV